MDARDMPGPFHGLRFDDLRFAEPVKTGAVKLGRLNNLTKCMRPGWQSKTEAEPRGCRGSGSGIRLPITRTA